MCNRILHSQKKQGRAFGVAPQVLDAAGQTFAKALHMKVLVDVVTDVPQDSAVPANNGRQEGCRTAQDSGRL